MRKVALVICLFMSVVPKSHASSVYETGNSIYEKCVSVDNFSAYGICLGFVETMADMLDPGLTEGGFIEACISKSVTRKQLVDVFINYLRANPQIRQKNAVSLAYLAYIAAFPCPRN